MPTPEDREGLAYHDGYNKGLQDGRHEGHQAGYAQGYKQAWADARKVTNGWAWTEKLPHLEQPPQVPAR